MSENKNPPWETRETAAAATTHDQFGPQKSLRSHSLQKLKEASKISAYWPPACPVCKKGPMEKRMQIKGQNPGAKFWGCRDFPRCKATRPLEHDPSQVKSQDA